MSTDESPRARRILVAGATGFIGRALVPVLLERGHEVRACARHVEDATPRASLEHVRCDLLDPASLGPALASVDAAYYLVHSMGTGAPDFRDRDRRAATLFARAAADAKLERVVYLGGVAPRGEPSEHLASRLEVGEILRAGAVPAIELRAAMIIGPGSASWQIVRDLALRLPVMVLPAWLSSRLSPIALEDTVRALVDALTIPLPESAWYDIPGPEVLSGKEILERVAAIEGRSLVSVSFPWLTPKLSAMWLRLVTGADYALARELVLGLTEDLVARDERYWELTGHPPARSFDDAARHALATERESARGRLGRLEESLVRSLGRRRGPAPA